MHTLHTNPLLLRVYFSDRPKKAGKSTNQQIMLGIMELVWEFEGKKCS